MAIQISKVLDIECTQQCDGGGVESLHVRKASTAGFDHGENSAAVLRVSGTPFKADDHTSEIRVILSPDECDALAEFLMALSRAKRREL